MRSEALHDVDRSELEPAVRDILDRHPDVLKAIQIRREFNRHPAFDFDVPAKYIHAWLGQLVHNHILVRTRVGNATSSRSVLLSPERIILAR